MDFTFNPDRTILGTAFTRAGEEEFSLSETDRMSHCLCIGKTGRGKTTLLENMIVQDIYAGRGVGLIDPHGDLSRSLLEHFPSFRARDLVLMDPADDERVVTFNVLACVEPARIAFRAASVVGSLKGLFADSWGYRLERILYNGVAALIEAPATSLLYLPRFLKSHDFRQQILRSVHDPIVLDYFETEYEVWDEKFRATALDPVLNKVEQLLAAPFVRATLGTITSSIDFGRIMDEKKVFIANLAKGRLGSSHAHVLGGLLVSKFSDSAMARDAVAADQRVPFYLYVDEFQNFATEAFAEIFSELRKMKLGAVLSHQYLSQAPLSLVDAVLGNVGSIAAFELSGKDAEIIAREIGLKSGSMLTEQSIGEAWVKHASYGGPHHPKLLPPLRPRGTGRAAALKQNYLRNTYLRARVDENIRQWFLSPKQEVQQTAPLDRWPRSLHLLRRALTAALKENGQDVTAADGTAGRAVDLQEVREHFFAARLSDASTEDERDEDRHKAFRRASLDAQQRRLVGALEANGSQWVWPLSS
jgi:hypothetical protein